MWLERCRYTCEGRITITGAEADTAARKADEINKGVIAHNLLTA